MKNNNNRLDIMVGQANHKLEHIQMASPLINVRELILLTFGLVDKPLTLAEAYTFTKNLSVRIKTILEFPMPKEYVFRQLITKLMKEGVIKQEYSLVQRKYMLMLNERGEGEFDYLLHSILSKEMIQIFDEYLKLIHLYS